MSILAPPVSPPPPLTSHLSSPELYPVELQTPTSPPIFLQRHSSPFPVQSFSALGPPPPVMTPSVVPPAPRSAPSTLPALTPDFHPQTPLPPTPDPSPPPSQLLGPTMVKLAPPSDEGYFHLPVISIDAGSPLATPEERPTKAVPAPPAPPPRPRRAQTAYPTRMVASRSADSRQRLTQNLPLPRTISLRDDSASDLATDGDGLEAKVVLLGSQGVGKTSLILRYTTRVFSPTPAPATIGSSLHARKLVHDGVRVKLQIWDTAGQERFRSMAPIYYRGAHVCVLVYDIASQQSFDDVRSWLEELGRTVPKETVIFVVGAKLDLDHRRAVTLDHARSAIRTWLKPPPAAPPPLPTLSPPTRSLFRTSTSVSRITPSRSHSFTALADAKSPKTTPFPARTPEVTPVAKPATPVSHASSPPARTRKRPTSPRPFSLHSPTLPTSATFTEPVSPSLSPTNSPRASHAARFSISGVLGLSRTTSMSEAVTSLHQLADAPTSPRRSTEAFPPQRSIDALGPRPTAPRQDSQSTSDIIVRPRVQSTPFGDRRRSEDWSGRSWKMGEGPSVATALSEFGDGVKRKQSGEVLAPAPLDRPVGRSRGGSLGRDPRLCPPDPDDGLWGSEVEGVRVGECSALTGQGVESLFRTITYLLVQRKDKIERERTLRRKDSVMLTEPVKGQEVKATKYGCCA